MKPGNQKVSLDVRFIVPAFFCLAMVSISGHADDLSVVSGNPESVAQDGEDPEAQRQKKMEECENNRGVDCERDVDAELGAGQVNDHGTLIQPDTPIQRPITPIPRPIPRPRPSR